MSAAKAGAITFHGRFLAEVSQTCMYVCCRGADLTALVREASVNALRNYVKTQPLSAEGNFPLCLTFFRVCSFNHTTFNPKIMQIDLESALGTLENTDFFILNDPWRAIILIVLPFSDTFQTEYFSKWRL